MTGVLFQFLGTIFPSKRCSKSLFAQLRSLRKETQIENLVILLLDFVLRNVRTITYKSALEKFGKDTTTIQRFIQMTVKGKIPSSQHSQILIH